MNNSTFKILFVVITKQTQKNGLVNISIRITINGDSLEFSSKIAIDPNLWDAEGGKLKGRTKMAVEGNTLLEKINSRLCNKYNEVEDKLGYVTPELLKKAFFRTQEKETTLLLLMDKKITQKKALAGASIQESAVEKYKIQEVNWKNLLLNIPRRKILASNKSIMISLWALILSKVKTPLWT